MPLKFKSTDIISGQSQTLAEQIYEKDDRVARFVQPLISRQFELSKSDLLGLKGRQLKLQLVKILNKALQFSGKCLSKLVKGEVDERLLSPALGSQYHFAVSSTPALDSSLHVDKKEFKKYINKNSHRKRRLMRLMLAQTFPEALDLTRWYVSLDLGSESMAAYFEHKTRPQEKQRGMVKLQSRAAKLHGANNFNDIMYSELNPRLRNRISINPPDGTDPFTPKHAALDFFKTNGNLAKTDGNQLDYKKSVFQYFHTPSEQAETGFIPNPKLLFQRSVPGLLPDIESASGNDLPVRIALLQHMTTQVFRNLVCHADNAPDDWRWRPEDIHLVVTVPNVYSLVHKQKLTSFLEAHSGAGRVSTHHESEAVAYYGYKSTPGGLGKDFADWRGNLNKRVTDEDIEKTFLLALDVGRGTADAALWQFSGNGCSDIVERTGSSDGGNRLSYCFVEYFDKCLKKAAAAYNKKYEQDVDPNFTFLHTTYPHDEYAPEMDQIEHLPKLEEMVERLKRSCTPDFTLAPDKCEEYRQQEQGKTYEELAKELAKGLVPESGDRPDDFRKDDFIDKVETALGVPSLPSASSGSTSNGIAAWLGSTRRRDDSEDETSASSPLERELAPYRAELLQDMQTYVRDVVGLIERLREEANEAEWRQARRSNAAFALVAGQASQFAPLRSDIREEMGRVGIANQCHELEGPSAKRACCRGAVALARSRNRTQLDDYVGGYYGFVDPHDQRFGLDMEDFRSGEQLTVECDLQGDHKFACAQTRIDEDRGEAGKPSYNPIVEIPPLLLNGDEQRDEEPPHEEPDSAKRESAAGSNERPFLLMRLEKIFRAIIRFLPFDREEEEEKDRYGYKVEYVKDENRIYVNDDPITQPDAHIQESDDLMANLWPEALAPKDT